MSKIGNHRVEVQESDDSADDAAPLIDCESCHGEGWYWNDLLREERPCIDCDGLGFTCNRRN